MGLQSSCSSVQLFTSTCVVTGGLTSPVFLGLVDTFKYEPVGLCRVKIGDVFQAEQLI